MGGQILVISLETPLCIYLVIVCISILPTVSSKLFSFHFVPAEVVLCRSSTSWKKLFRL